MTFERHTFSRGISRRWIACVGISVLWLVLSPCLASAFGTEDSSCSKSNTYPIGSDTAAGTEGDSDSSDIALPAGWCESRPAAAGHAPAFSAGETASSDNPASSSTQDEKDRLKVNPLTGLALAPGSYTPLTRSDRWNLYLRMTYASAGPYLSPAVNALLLDQANGTPRQWGGGFAGFGRRLASRAGNAVLQGSFQAPLAAMLHEDVRYIPTTQRSVQRRALHAVLYSFLTYNNKGHPTLNVANLSAFYASTAVTTIWLPGVGNAVKYTLSNASEQIALSFPLNVVQEFWPEIRRHIFRRH